MIGRLSGELVAVDGDTVVLDTGGVGYVVQVSFDGTPGVRESLWIETVIRQDMITLFGFRDTIGRDWFRLLTGVQGVGGRLAMQVLRALPPSRLAGVVASGDRRALTGVPGLGARLSQRLLGELSARQESLPAATDVPPTDSAGVVADVISALVNLGYAVPEARRAVSGLDPADGFSSLMTAALRRLAPGASS